MIYIIGLGNPGNRYKETRHNVGFLFLEYYNRQICKGKIHAPDGYHYFTGSVAGEKAVFVMPQTFMNCSGDIVPKLRRKFGPPDSVIIIYDDIALPVGKLRIRKNGSSGGHNGVQSLINAFGTQELGRIRIGISNPTIMDLKDYVLSKINPEEMTIFTKLFVHAAEAVDAIVTRGYEHAMAMFNGIAISE